jgi:hypothetical protein
MKEKIKLVFHYIYGVCILNLSQSNSFLERGISEFFLPHPLQFIRIIICSYLMQFHY